MAKSGIFIHKPIKVEAKRVMYNGRTLWSIEGYKSDKDQNIVSMHVLEDHIFRQNYEPVDGDAKDLVGEE